MTGLKIPCFYRPNPDIFDQVSKFMHAAISSIKHCVKLFFYTGSMICLLCFLCFSCLLQAKAEENSVKTPSTPTSSNDSSNDSSEKNKNSDVNKAHKTNETTSSSSDTIPTPAPSPLLIEYGPLTFAPLVKKVVPAVVNIAVVQSSYVKPSPLKQNQKQHIPPSLKGTPFEKEFRQRLHQQRQKTTEAGSGFLINAQGVIVTNTHVIGNSTDITVSLTNGKRFPATLIGNDPLTDIAVIKINAKEPLPHVEWGDSRKVEVGDWILAAGNPFGLGSSVTAGIVSARGRDIGSGPFDDFLQLDAPMNPGNSGGPSFNLAGQVVALNTAIVSPTGSSVGIGFGIPSEIAAPIVAQLCKTGFIDRGWLGVTLEEDGQAGVRIIEVEKNSPAAQSKVRVNDHVELINDQHVDTVRTFIKTVAMAHPGSVITLKLKRNRQFLTLPVTVGHRPQDNEE